MVVTVDLRAPVEAIYYFISEATYIFSTDFKLTQQITSRDELPSCQPRTATSSTCKPRRLPQTRTAAVQADGATPPVCQGNWKRIIRNSSDNEELVPRSINTRNMKCLQRHPKQTRRAGYDCATNSAQGENTQTRRHSGCDCRCNWRHGTVCSFYIIKETGEK